MTHAAIAETARPIDGPGLSVLVLDDSRIDRARTCRLARRTLPAERIDEASDLAEFGESLDTRPFDLVFLDYNLGPKTGLDALAMLTGHPRQHGAAAIMLTGSIGPDLADTAFRAGCMEFLAKDAFDEDSLVRAVERARGRKEVAMALGG